MLDPDDHLASILRRALAAGAPAVALDVHAGTQGYVAAYGGYRPCVHIELVLAVPSDVDSRYRVDYLGSLPAATAEEVAASREQVSELAARLGAAVHPPGGTPRTHAEPSWLALQPPAPERPWRVVWSSLVWSDDGAEHCDAGERVVVATTGKLAKTVVEQELVRRLAPPFRCKVECPETGPAHEQAHEAGYPDTVPAVDTLRAQALAGRSPAVLLGELAIEAAASTPLERMVALARAFELDLRDLGPVSAFCSGRLTAEALDAVVGPWVERSRPRWSLPLLLRRARAEGRSIARLLHEGYDEHQLGVIHLIMAMREAFGLSLMAAKTLVDTACPGDRDDELDRLLAAELQSAAGR